MHLKDLLGSIARVGYCMPVQDIYIVLHGPISTKICLINQAINPTHRDTPARDACAASSAASWSAAFAACFGRTLAHIRHHAAGRRRGVFFERDLVVHGDGVERGGATFGGSERRR